VEGITHKNIVSFLKAKESERDGVRMNFWTHKKFFCGIEEELEIR
jgi:hypothetical protein